TLPDAVDLSWLSRPPRIEVVLVVSRASPVAPAQCGASTHHAAAADGRHSKAAHRIRGSSKPSARRRTGGCGLTAAARRSAAGGTGGGSAPADLTSARMWRGGRSTKTQNAAALPASMGPTPEGRRRVIGTQLEAGSACALAVASQGRLRACALAQGAALASKQVASKQVGCATRPWAVPGAVRGAVRAWAGRGWAGGALSGYAWAGCVQSSRQATRADQQFADRQPWGMPTGDPARRFLPGPNSFSRTACASRARCTSDFGPKR